MTDHLIILSVGANLTNTGVTLISLSRLMYDSRVCLPIDAWIHLCCAGLFCWLLWYRITCSVCYYSTIILFVLLLIIHVIHDVMLFSYLKTLYSYNVFYYYDVLILFHCHDVFIKYMYIVFHILLHCEIFSFLMNVFSTCYLHWVDAHICIIKCVHNSVVHYTLTYLHFGKIFSCIH